MDGAGWGTVASAVSAAPLRVGVELARGRERGRWPGARAFALGARGRATRSARPRDVSVWVERSRMGGAPPDGMRLTASACRVGCGAPARRGPVLRSRSARCGRLPPFRAPSGRFDTLCYALW